MLSARDLTLRRHMHGGLQAEHADLARDEASMELRWMEVGTALEAAETLSEDPD